VSLQEEPVARSPQGPGRAPQQVASPALGVGERLADRYHLLVLVADGEVATRWRAHDDVLARPVAV
jgi:hypothetical protein